MSRATLEATMATSKSTVDTKKSAIDADKAALDVDNTNMDTAVTNMETIASNSKDPYPRVVDVSNIMGNSSGTIDEVSDTMGSLSDALVAISNAVNASHDLHAGFKAGRETFTGAEVRKQITFTAAFADANYTVAAMSCEGSAGLANVNCWADTPVAASFFLNISAAPGGADTVVVHWIAIHD